MHSFDQTKLEKTQALKLAKLGLTEEGGYDADRENNDGASAEDSDEDANEPAEEDSNEFIDEPEE